MANKMKWRIIPIFIVIIAILAISMAASVSAASYSISTSNSTNSINNFFSDEDYYDPNIDDYVYSPLANGDTVIFNAGTYNVNLDVNKDITLKANGKVVIKGITINKNTQISGFTINGNLNVYGSGNTVSGNTINGNMWVQGKTNKITGNTLTTKNLHIYCTKSTITGNKLPKGNLIYYVAKSKNTLKNNEEIPYVFFELKYVKKTSKGITVKATNRGNKNAGACNINIVSADFPNSPSYGSAKVKVSAIKKGKSKTVFIPKSKFLNSKAWYDKWIVIDLNNKIKSTNKFSHGFVKDASKLYPSYFK